MGCIMCTARVGEFASFGEGDCSGHESSKSFNIGSSKQKKSHFNPVEQFLTMAHLVGNKLDSVRNMLNNESSRESFGKFLKSEYCEENLLFYMAIENIQASTLPPIEILSLIFDLCGQFLYPSSANEVNLSSATRNQLLADVDSARVASLLLDAPDKPTQLGDANNRAFNEAVTAVMTSLRKAQEDIIVVIATDSFPRYLKSPFYTAWRKEATVQSIQSPHSSFRIVSSLSGKLNISLKSTTTDTLSSRSNSSKSSSFRSSRRIYRSSLQSSVIPKEEDENESGSSENSCLIIKKSLQAFGSQGSIHLDSPLDRSLAEDSASSKILHESLSNKRCLSSADSSESSHLSHLTAQILLDKFPELMMLEKVEIDRLVTLCNSSSAPVLPSTRLSPSKTFIAPTMSNATTTTISPTTSNSMNDQSDMFLDKHSPEIVESDLTMTTLTGWFPGFLSCLELLPEAFVVINASRSRPRHPVIFVNSSFEKLTGYKREEIVGEPCSILQQWHPLLHNSTKGRSVNFEGDRENAGASDSDLGLLPALSRETLSVVSRNPSAASATQEYKCLTTYKAIRLRNKQSTGAVEYVVGMLADISNTDVHQKTLETQEHLLSFIPSYL